MRYIWSFLFLLAWGLWLGSLVMLFLTLEVLFRSDRNVAVQVGPVLFPVYGWFQLGVGAVALIAALGMRIAARSGVWMFILIASILALVPGVAEQAWLTPKMIGIWNQNQGGNAEFKQLHGYSMMLYSSTMLLLLLLGLALPAALKPVRKPF